MTETTGRRAVTAGWTAGVAALVAAAWMLSACSRAEPPAVAPGVAIGDPPTEFADGQRLFLLHCARCHGPGGAGTGHGPPFLSKIYEPSHHGDASFLMAVRRGVSAHHWRFGDMPPIPGVSDDDAARIVAYIRWAQRQAGIT
jgi:mono/diheme cytochrome c family protein